ncbi:hypothetical protein TraAM80_03647 [Trypanosoma rangeli]|uniref:Uncharacterized protein n=1 Tax=Trypanosoma rangeli TaxID=5698 RepID=A0A422NN36_TRYRA|nr:uncharacterized protein TraAM80_03647 [Trypanosoma rangeli]RNF06814.1 hypothetical protein TraAM80_03647 [Trypanosoma rangeli]|eukprot:RNF06814.1 hypothetical protein TraAM80_03647 [Trypanosoma rangeli]
MDDAIELLESRPLVGFQMDGSHLHSILKKVIQEQQQQAQFQRQMGLRLSDLEEELRSMNMRQKELEKALGSANPDTLRKMRQELEYLDEGLGNLARDVKETRSLGEKATRAAEDAGRGVQSMGRELGAMRGRQDQFQQNLDELAQENRQLGDAVNAVERELSQQAQNLIHDLEQINSRENVQKLRDMLDELCERTDKNFRSVEESARAVDAELIRHRSDINGLQADVGSLDDQVRQHFSNITKDVDARCQMILDTLREQERSSLEIEEHMVAAGQALARRKALKESHSASGARAHDSFGTRRNGW